MLSLKYRHYSCAVLFKHRLKCRKSIESLLSDITLYRISCVLGAVLILKDYIWPRKKKITNKRK